MADHDQRRPLSLGRPEPGIRGRVDVGEGGAGRRPSGTRAVRGIENTAGSTSVLALSRSTSTARLVKSSNTTCSGESGPPGDERDLRTLRHERGIAHRGVRDVQVDELARRRIEQGGVVAHPRCRSGRRSFRHRGTRTTTLRRSNAATRTRRRAGTRSPVCPPRSRSRFHQSLRSLTQYSSPAGLHEGCQIDSSPSRPATVLGSPSEPSGASAASCSSHPVPRHPGQIPRQPADARAVRARSGDRSRSPAPRRSPVAPPTRRSGSATSSFVTSCGNAFAGVSFTDADPRRAVGRHAAVGETVRAARLRRDRDRLTASRHVAVEPLVV